MPFKKQKQNKAHKKPLISTPDTKSHTMHIEQQQTIIDDNTIETASIATESQGSDVINPQSITESTPSMEADDELDEILNDPLTLLTTEQHNKLKQDGYCMMDDPLNNKEIEIIVSGYVRENYNGNQMELYVIKEMVYFYGTQWNAKLFIELICPKPTLQHFLVPRRNLTLSKVLNEQMNDEKDEENDGIKNKIELDDTSSDTLHYALRYLGHHKGKEPDPLPCPVRSIHMNQIVSDQWDAQYIDPLEKKIIFEIIMVANKLGIQSLIHLGCAKIATLIKQLDQQEINRIIEEEEAYRRQHANDNDDANDDDNDDDNDNDNQNKDDEEEKNDMIETIQ